jgi:drug/metabolite transporter (DMT)-like permease
MICCASVVSFGGLIHRNFEDIESFEIIFFRSSALIFYMICYLGIKYKKKFHQRVIGIGFKGLIASCIFGLAQVSYLIAFNFTSVANTTFTLCITPFVTAIIAYLFLKEIISTVTLITMLLATLGVIIMVTGGVAFGAFIGIIFALITSIAFATFAVILRSNRDLDMMPTLLVTGVITLIVGYIFGSFESKISWRDIILCFVWGGFLQGFAHSLMIKATRLILSAEVTLFMLLEFTLGPLWVWVFINEIPVFSTLLGGGIIISAVALLAAYEVRQSLTNNKVKK